MSAAATHAPPAIGRIERLERLFEIPMFVAAVLVVPVIVIEASDPSRGWRVFGDVLNWIVWTAFAVELLTMLTASPSRLDWLRAHPLEVAIVVATPPFLPASLQALRLFRLLRLLRVLAVVKEYRRVFTGDGIKFASVVAVVAALGGGAIFANVEKGHSTWDGVWWSVTTMATVGYGDLAPKTVVGRLLGILLMVVGVGFFALITGGVAQRFIAASVREDVETAEQELATEVESVRTQLVQELRELTSRLQSLEQRIREL
jgi:voltage-gated potassium channel